jgi:hemoglobin-like flavoprotein
MAAEQLPAGVRGGVGALPTPEGELEYLKRTYPKANIVPIDIAGQTEYLIKNQDGTSFTTLDKGVAGTAGMLAVEAPIALGSAAAGIGTAIATKSPVTATLAAGGTEAVLGTAADAITRAALEMPQQFGEDVGRRGLQAGIGTVLGLGIDVVPSAMIANRVPNKFQNEFLEQFQGSAERLGLDSTAVPAGAQFGPQGLTAGEDLSGLFPGSIIAGRKRKTQESVKSLFNNFLATVPKTANDFSAIAVNQEGQRRALANSIARANNKSAAVIDDAVSKILKPRAKTNVDDLGEVLRTNIEIAEAEAKRATDNQYTMMADMANDAGFKIRAEDLLKIVSIIKKQANPKKAFDESATNGVENRLRLLVADKNKISSIEKRIAGEKDVVKSNKLLRQIESIKKRGDLNFKNLDDYIKAFNDARPDNAVGGTTKDALGAKVSSEISKLRKRIYSNFKVINPDGTVSNLGDEFEKATKLVQERIAFEGNTLGRVLKEVVGEQATTPRDIVSSVMKEPFTIDRVLQVLKNLELNDPTQAGITDKLQGMMRLQYLNDLGVGSKKGVVRLDYDQGMLDSLYGNKAAATARGLDSINDKLKVLKSANVPEMTLTDLNALSSALSKDARDEVANGIIKRNALEKKEEALVRSSIFQAASKGNFENIDPDLLSKSILSKSSSISDTRTTMAKLSQASLQSRNLFKGDFMRNLLDEYPGGTPSAAAPYTPLFDVKKFLADWESPTGKSQFAQKLEIVLGKDGAQRFYDFAKVWQGAKITNVEEAKANTRILGTSNKVTFVVPITPILSYGRNRYLAAMLATGSEQYGLKSALARGSLAGDMNDVYVKTFNRMFATREGMEALIHQTSSDPEFSVELQNAVREFEEKEGLDLGGK